MAFLTRDPLDLSQLLARARRNSDGGVAIFVGVVRDANDGKRVERIEYSAYEAMAEKEFERIDRELGLEFPESAVAMKHRIGTLFVGEASVLIVASSPHRNEAFAACRQAIEKIKARVPIWKKES